MMNTNTFGFKLPVQAYPALQKTKYSAGISKSEVLFTGKSNEKSGHFTNPQANGQESATNVVDGEKESLAEMGGYCLIMAMIAALVAPLFAMPPLITGVLATIKGVSKPSVEEIP